MNNSDKNKRSCMGTIVSFLIYGMLSVLLTLLLILLLSALVANESLPEIVLNYCGTISTTIASLVSGFISARVFGRALLTSVIQGTVNLAVFYFAGLIIFMRIIPNNVDAGSIFACMAGAAAGGVLAALFSPHGCKIKK